MDVVSCNDNESSDLADNSSTVGCLLAHGYRSLDTLLSCTVSTGTNAGKF